MLRRLLAALAIPTAAIALLAGPASAATPVSGAPINGAPVGAPQTQGIIMSDGRICNPRWGC